MKQRLNRRSPVRLLALALTGLAIARFVERTTFVALPEEVIWLSIGAVVCWIGYGWHTRYLQRRAVFSRVKSPCDVSSFSTVFALQEDRHACSALQKEWHLESASRGHRPRPRGHRLRSDPPALAQPSRARTGEVIAIRELQLKAERTPAQFEQFVRSTYNPAWEGAVPGMKGYIAKADRGAQKDSYALILVFDGEKTRDIVFPKEGGGASAAFAALVQPLLALNKDLDKFVEPGSLSVYTDYVVLR